jgi:hypothetical protein
MRIVALVSAALASAALIACSVESTTPPPAPGSGSETEKESGKSTETEKTPSSETAGETSGVSGSKELGSLTAAEKGKLCDWKAAKSGGYGKSTSCDDGVTVKGDTDQADCVSSFPVSCSATVAELEACVKVDIVDPCALAVLTASECAPLRECMQ